MGRDDWYRRTTWTEVDRTEFQQRLRRSRGDFHKAQYASIQAGYLADAGEIEGAIDLLNQVLAEFPVKSQLASAHLQMAECLIAKDNASEAIGEFRAALDAEKAHPNVRTSVWLDFPWFVVTRGMSDLYDEARSFLDWGKYAATFPIDEYRLATVLALMAHDEGDTELAQKHAAAALTAAAKEHSGFRYHPKLGLVSSQNAAIKDRLESLARA